MTPKEQLKIKKVSKHQSFPKPRVRVIKNLQGEKELHSESQSVSFESSAKGSLKTDTVILFPVAHVIVTGQVMYVFWRE